MSLQMIFGGSGSGKSNYVYSRILEQSKAEPDRTFFILVPEQFTMQTQRELVLRQENHSIMNVDVVSFNRLAFRVFDELGKGSLSILEETGKNLVLRRVAETQQENLQLIKTSMKKSGYINEVKSVISELTQYQIEPGHLDTFVQDESQPPLFRFKIQDIQTMYQGFLEYLKGRYITAEELLEVLAQLADQSQILKDSVIVLDGFTGFTPVQYSLLRELMKTAGEILVTITLDEREDPWHTAGIQELFYMSKKTAKALQEIGEQTCTSIKEPCWTRHSEQSRFGKSPALLWLEQNLFRTKSGAYSKQAPEIAMYSLMNPRQELHFIAAEIKRLVREEQYRYKDFAIVCGNVEMYGNYAKEIMDSYEIPLFLDTKKNIVFHPMAEFLKRSLSLLEQDFSYETVLGYLRCGLSGISLEEVDLLENYLLAQGIRGYKKWQSKWVRRRNVKSQEELDQINELREKLVQQFQPLREVFRKKDSTVMEQSRIFYEMIYSLDVELQLREYEQNFVNAREPALAKEYAQIYKTVMDLMDKMAELLGGEHLSLREYREILEAGLEAAAIGIIPPGYDRVVFGDIERTRLSDVKVLFFAGVNDGLIPKAVEHGGIISQSDRECFAAHGMELAPTDQQRSFIQRFYLYLNLTKPSNRLYITWFRVSQDGKETRKSYLVGTILKMFPKIQVKQWEKQSALEQIVTPESSMVYFIEKLKNIKREGPDAVFKALYWWYRSKEEWKDRAVSLLDAAFYQYQAGAMGAQVTAALYGTVLENSVTRLEQFCTCAFSHFLEYGLQLEERSLGEFAPVDMGSLFHQALERYSIAMEKAGYHWFDVPREERERMIEGAVEDTLGAESGNLVVNDARTAYLISRVKRILRRTIETIAQQIQTSHFSPEGYEISFSFEEDLDSVTFSLSEEEKMRLRGRIDRIDTRKEEDKIYVKVVDYKSGSQDFQLLSLYHGLQLQLVVYMNSALELVKRKYPDKEVVPGGMYYYHLDDPVVEGDFGKSDAEIREKILEELKLKGVGAQIEDASVSKKSQKAGEEEFQVLSNFVSHKIREIGHRIFSGEIGANPYQLGDRTGCDYCPYHGVCGFDASIPGQDYQRMENIKEQDIILERMRREVSQT